MQELIQIDGELKDIDGVPMMSSKQIAEFLSKAEGRKVRHDNVKRTMDRLENKALLAFTPMEDEQFDAMNRPRKVELLYIDHDAAILVVAQMCPEVTAALVKDWQRLTNENYELKQVVLELSKEVRQLAANQANPMITVDPPKKKITRKRMTQENYDIIKGFVQANISIPEMAERTGYAEPTVRSVKNGAYDWKYGPEAVKQAIVNINQ